MAKQQGATERPSASQELGGPVFSGQARSKSLRPDKDNSDLFSRILLSKSPEIGGDMLAGLDRSYSQIARRIEGDNVRAIIPIWIGDVQIDVVRWEDVSGWV